MKPKIVPEHLEIQAKNLRAALYAEHGLQVFHREALDIVAKMNGHNNWSDLKTQQAFLQAS